MSSDRVGMIQVRERIRHQRWQVLDVLNRRQMIEFLKEIRMVKIQQSDIDSLVGSLLTNKVPDKLAQLLGVALAQLCAGIVTVIKPPNNTPFTDQVYTDADVPRVYYFGSCILIGMASDLIERLRVESIVSDDPTIMPNPNPAFTVGMQAVNEVFTPAKALALGTSGR